MTDQTRLQGTSVTSFADAAQDAAAQIKELPDDQEVTFRLTEASVTVGGITGKTTYSVVLEKATQQ